MATITVTKGYNDPTGWISGEEVTPAKLNQAQTPTVSLSAIQTTDISDAQITTAKIADEAVGLTKLATALRQATEASVGLLEIATNAETLTGTDAVRAVTPAALASVFANSVGTSGYQKFQSGLILQWGAISAAQPAGGGTITFPITFPSNCFCVVATLAQPTNFAHTAHANNVTTANFNVSKIYASSANWGSSSASGFWLAIGN